MESEEEALREHIRQTQSELPVFSEVPQPEVPFVLSTGERERLYGKQEEPEAFPLWDRVSSAASEFWYTSEIMRNYGVNFEPDAEEMTEDDFAELFETYSQPYLDTETGEYMPGINEEQFREAVGDSISKDHLIHNIGGYITQNKNNKIIFQGAPISGGLIALGVSMADPSMLVTGTLAGTLLRSYKVFNTGSRISQAVKRGSVYAAADTSVSAAVALDSPTHNSEHVFTDAVAGYLVGTSLDYMLNIGVTDAGLNVAEKVYEQRVIRDAIESKKFIPSKSTIKKHKEMFDDDGNLLSEVDHAKKLFASLPDHQSYGSGWRWDVASSLGGSKNPFTRKLGKSMVFDPAGSRNKGEVVGESAEEFMEVEFMRKLYSFQVSHNENFRAWLKATGKGDLGNRFRHESRAEFNRLTTRYVRSGGRLDEFKNADDAIKAITKHGDTIKGLQDDLLHMAVKPDIYDQGLVNAVQVRGAGEVAADPIEDYMSRVWNTDYILNQISLGREDEIRQTIARSIRGLDGDEADEFARELLKTFKSGKQFLQDSNGVKSSVFSRFRSRIDLDELSPGLDEFLENDSEVLFTKYARSMTGRVALARQGIDSDETFAKLLDEAIINYDSRTGSTKRKAEIKNLQDSYDSIVGRGHHLESTGLGGLARILGNYNYSRFMNMAGIAQLAEIGTAMTETSITAMLKQVPELRKVLKTIDGSPEYADQLANDLVYLFGGSGQLKLLNPIKNNVAEVGASDPSGRLLGNLETWTASAADVTSDISLMNKITSLIQHASNKAIIDEFAKAARTGKHKQSLDRLADMGLSEESLQRIYKHFNDKNMVEISKYGNVKALNFDKWDSKTYAEFSLAVNRISGKAVQRQYIGSRISYIGRNPLTRLLFQFRAFVMGAWGSNFMYNFKHRDLQSAQGVMLGTLFGMLSVYTQTKLVSLTKEDSEEYMRKQLGDYENGEYGKLATGALSRAPFASIMPGIVGTAASIPGVPFETTSHRSSGQANSFITGSPIYQLGTQGVQGLAGGIFSMLGPDEVSSQDVRNLGSLLPFYNFLGVNKAVNALASERPSENSDW